MDTTLKVVVVAAVLLMVGVVMFFLVSDKAGDFSGTSDEEVTRSQCELWKVQRERAQERGDNDRVVELNQKLIDAGCISTAPGS